MKKLISIVAAGAIAFSLSGCADVMGPLEQETCAPEITATQNPPSVEAPANADPKMRVVTGADGTIRLGDYSHLVYSNSQDLEMCNHDETLVAFDLGTYSQVLITYHNIGSSITATDVAEIYDAMLGVFDDREGEEILELDVVGITTDAACFYTGDDQKGSYIVLTAFGSGREIYTVTLQMYAESREAKDDTATCGRRFSTFLKDLSFSGENPVYGLGDHPKEPNREEDSLTTGPAENTPENTGAELPRENSGSETEVPHTTGSPYETEAPRGSSPGGQNALRQAKDYLSVMAFSYSGLIHQLEYEGYSTAEATYAADNCGADWYEQAMKMARSYLSASAFSYSGLIHQLEYEGFSTDESTYGADNCGADWYEQAMKMAASYLESMAFSRDDLIRQLEYEGFTYDQAVYGAEKNGY